MAPFFVRELRKVRRENWPALLVVGLLGTGIPAFCYPIAETQISSITTGILNSLTPLFTILIGALFFKVPATWSRILGVLLGLGGAILIISRSAGDDDHNLLFGLFVVFGTLCYAFSGNTIKSKLQNLNSVTIGVVAFTILGPPALIILLSTDIAQVFSSDPNVWISFPAVCFLSIFGTAAASILYFKLVQMTSAVFASMVAYLIPIVAVMLGMLDGETITWIHGVGFILIMGGIYLSRRG